VFYDEDSPDDDLELARRIWRRRTLGLVSVLIATASVLYQGYQANLLGKLSFLLMIPTVPTSLASLGLLFTVLAPPKHSTKRLATVARDARRAGAPLRARSWVWVASMVVGSAVLAGVALRLIRAFTS
jgi:hypothetical protein